MIFQKHYQSSNLSASATLTATIEPKPGAPSNITLRFDGPNAGRLMGITHQMEYSIDRSVHYNSALDNHTLSSNNEIPHITASNDIRIMISGTLRTPANDVYVIDILPGPGIPDVSKNDETNSVIGLTTAMEYSKDSTSIWTRYNGRNLPPNAIDSTLLKNAGENSWVKISMDAVDEKEIPKVLGDAVKDDGNGLYAIGGKVYNFVSRIIAGEKTEEIASFKKDVTITISLDKRDMKSIDPEKLGVYWYNETNAAEYIATAVGGERKSYHYLKTCKRYQRHP